MRRRGLLLTAVLVLAALGATAWWTGGGDPQAKRRYIAAVDAVCADATRQTEDQETPETPAQEVAELRRAAGLMAANLARIERITPPREDVASLRRGFLDPSRRLVTRLETLAGRAEADLKAGRSAAAHAVVEESLAPDPVETGLRDFAEDYGFVTCSGL